MSSNRGKRKLTVVSSFYSAKLSAPHIGPQEEGIETGHPPGPPAGDLVRKSASALGLMDSAVIAN